MSERSSPEIRKFVLELLEKIAAYKKPVEDSTELFYDVGLTGDDASEFMQAIAAKFPTDFNAFRFINYFPYEGEIIPRWQKRNSFTVGHLVQVIYQGVWSLPAGPYTKILDDSERLSSSPAEARRFWVRVALIFAAAASAAFIKNQFF